MGRTWVVVAIALAACDEPLVLGRTSSSKDPAPARPEPAQTTEPPPAHAAPRAPADAAVQVDAKAPSGIQVFTARDPAFLAIAGDTLMWTDGAGSLWSMPSRGGTPVELANQHQPGLPMYGALGAHRGEVIASRTGALVHVKPPRGPIEPVLEDLGNDSLLDLASDGDAIYATSFLDRKAVYRIGDGTREKLLELPWPEVEVVGETLYALSYRNGALVAVNTSGGKPRTIARGLSRGTGFAVDEAAAYVWREKDRAIRRVDLKTGKSKRLAGGFENTDVLVLDGDWIYAFSWNGIGTSTFFRVAKDGSRVEVLANDLTKPSAIAVDADAVFVSDRYQNRIIRFDKRAIRPL